MEQTLADIAVGEKGTIVGFEKGSQQYRGLCQSCRKQEGVDWLKILPYQVIAQII